MEKITWFATYFGVVAGVVSLAFGIGQAYITYISTQFQKNSDGGRMVDRLFFIYHVAMEQVRNNYKRKFGYGEFYRILLDAMRAMPNMAKNRRQGVLSPQFVERIMLAVTEANGCAACSYAHTRMALKEGMDSSEIAAMLSGNTGTSTGRGGEGDHVLPTFRRGKRAT